MIRRRLIQASFLLVFVGGLATSCSGKCERVGAYWKTCTQDNLTMDGPPTEHLREVGLLGSRELADYTFDVRPLTASCVFYGSTRGRERYYAACYARAPLLLAESNGDWEVKDDRLIHVNPARFDGCDMVEAVDFIDLRRRAPAAAARNFFRTTTVPLSPETMESRTAATETTADGRVPLIEAAASGTVGDVQRLVECGANVNGRDGKGDSPLMAASGASQGDRSKIDTVRYLLSRGADVRARDRVGHDALFYGCANPEVARMLVDAGADRSSCGGEQTRSSR